MRCMPLFFVESEDEVASGVIQRKAFVTLATNDSYSLGALVLAHSLRRAGTAADIVCMITHHVSPACR